MAEPELAEIKATLADLGDRLVADLAELFGHRGLEARVREGEGLRLVVQGEQGHLEVAWPPSGGLTEAEGPVGAHARIALELNLASEHPGDFFEGHRPVNEARRRFFFDQLAFYVEDSLGETGYYDPLVVEERGPVLLIFSDDEYVLVAESGKRRGQGLLDWKVRRLVSYALTDADERFDT